MQLQKGQRGKLSDLGLGQQFVVQLEVSNFDTACFGVDGQEKLSDDRYMVFYNQNSSPDNAITFQTQGQTQQYSINLSTLNSKIPKLVFTITAPDNQNMTHLASGQISIRQNNTEIAQYSFQAKDFSNERAVMGLELYQKDGVWRLHACGQGFAGGLAALVQHFGGEVAAPAPVAPPVSAPLPVVAPPVAAPPPPAPKISLTKVNLDKRGESAKISLRKDIANTIHVNLNWNQQAKRGFLGMSTPAADLDLGCMFELEDGNKGVFQALGKNMGQKGQYPHIYIDKDDRSGASANGENLYIERPDLIKRVLVFTFIYEGARNGFQEVEGRLKMTDPAGNEITLSLNNPDAKRTFCAVALIQKIGGEISIRKEELYYEHHGQADQHFGFGFRWSAGSKD
jgi:tellurite resistance protein TerA